MEFLMHSRILGLLAGTSVAAIAVACGGGTDVTTAPTGCAAALSPAAQNAPAAGGTFAVAITVAQRCEWTAKTDAGWITLTRTSGSGSGSAAYTVAPNTSALNRQGQIRIGDEALAVTQSPSNCSYAVEPPSARVAAAGGTVDLRIATSDGCTWSASASDAWIALSTTSGSGTGPISISIGANTANAERSGSVQIEGQTIAVSQDSASALSCSFDVSPREATLSASGGNLQVRLSATNEACGWTAQAGAGWIGLDRTSGTGSTTVTATLAANDGAERRSATILAGGRIITVIQDGESQPDACSVTLSASAFNIPAAGGTAEIDVNANAGCAWQTEGRPDWIRQNPQSGSGTGRTTLTVDANTTRSARTATLRLGGQPLTVTQAGACAYSVNTTSQNVDDRGGTFQVALTTEPGCGWTAKGSQPWMTATPASGSGSGPITYSVGANTATAERKGTLLIATETVSITQSGAACAVALDRTSDTIGVNGGPLGFGVVAPPGCGWTSDTKEGWIRVESGSGSGNGTVRVTVAPSASASERRGSISVEGRTFTVVQAPCTYRAAWLSIATGARGRIEDTMTAAGSGDTLVVSVDTGQACGWQNSRPPDWIAGLSAGDHRGPADLKLPVTCNTTKLERRGSMSIAGREAAIVQPFDPTGRCVR
jgi:hypothetical protein